MSIQRSLEAAFGRHVQIERVHFSLFSGPGFILDNVTIEEDQRFGIEPFAFIPTLEVRVRLDKLLLGQIRPQGLTFTDASLNLVKNSAGEWNAVSLIERLGAPQRAPFNFLPALKVSNARIDFKLGRRKTNLYLTETDISIYPERSGKIYFRFNASPARTDRAGNGFGHLSGTANWYVQPVPANSNQLEADLDLEPSNLSELATLVRGEDLGIHGIVSAHVLIDGPFSNLQAHGDLQFQNLHRWDLIQFAGDRWPVAFESKIDLRSQTLELTAHPHSSSEFPLMITLRAVNFLTHPAWSVLANVRNAPIAGLLPLGRRLGLGLPADLRMTGAIDGVIGFSSSAGFEGAATITDATATLPGVPDLRSSLVKVGISGETIQIEPATLESGAQGRLRARVDFNTGTQSLITKVQAEQFSVAAFKKVASAWFENSGPFSRIDDGQVTGNFVIAKRPNENPDWSGQAQLVNASAVLPGIAAPMRRLQAHASIDADMFELTRMAGDVEHIPFWGTYRYDGSMNHPEYLRLQLATIDLAQVEALLAPTLTDDSLFSRLPFTRRNMPAWLTSRRMDGDITADRVTVQQQPMGSFSTHFVWQGTGIQLTNSEIRLQPGGVIRWNGNLSLRGRVPKFHVDARLSDYPCGGGLLSLQGSGDTFGMSPQLEQNARASGEFMAENTHFSDKAFHSLTGNFQFRFDGLAPILDLTSVKGVQSDVEWSGAGSTLADGEIHLQLSSGSRQLLLVTNLDFASTVPEHPLSNR